MGTRKKKKQPISQKTANSQQRNIFLSYLKDYFKKITGSEEIFKLLPKKELEWLYEKRFRPIKVKAGLNQNIPKCIIQYCQNQIKQEFKENLIPINVGSLETITYHDYFSIGYTISTYQGILQENEYKGAKVVKEALSEFSQRMNSNINEEAWEKFAWVSEILSILFSDLITGLCVINNVKVMEPNYVGFCLELFEVATDKKHISVDGEKRIANKLGWMTWQGTLNKPELKMEYVTITGEKIGLANNTNLEIYIQNHALIRLNERMDDINQGLLHYNTFQSLKCPKVCRNKDGQLLIEFRMSEVKTGYFIAEHIEGVLLLKTFLFLINDCTPEGEKLHQNTGLMKNDKMYLNIDKISAFLNSDIILNDKVKQIFINAGCESLFKVDKSAYLGEVEKQKKLADFLKRHLELDSHDLN